MKPARTLCLALAAGLAAGCSYFTTQPDPAIATRIHDRIPHGMAMDEAESQLNGLNFSCSYRGGTYEAEDGRSRSADRFLICERRPAELSFQCENRDHVVVVPDRAALVQAVEVTRGPSCASP